MKKTLLLAALCVAAGPSHAVSLLNNQYGAIDMTGRAYAGHYFGDERTSEMYGSNTFLRFGLKGKSKINDTLTAIGTYEGQLNVGDKSSPSTVPTIDTEKGSTVATRLAFGGVSNADWGTLTYGRQNGAAVLVTGWTDVSLTDGYGNHGLGVGVDKFGTKRSSDVVKYSLSYQQMGLDLSYKLRTTQDTCADGTCTSKDSSGNAQTEVAVDKDNSAYGAAVVYKPWPVFNLGASYNVGQQGIYDDAKLWTLNGKYDDKALYGALAYGSGDNWYKPGYDHTGYEAALGYNFLNGVGVLAMWNKQQAEGVGSASAKDLGKTTDTANYYTLGANYKFNRRLSLAAEFRLNNKAADSFAAVKDPVTGLKVDASNDWQLAGRYDF